MILRPELPYVPNGCRTNAAGLYALLTAGPDGYNGAPTTLFGCSSVSPRLLF